MGLVVQQGLNETLASTRQLLWTNAGIGLLIILIGYIIAFFLSAKISNPITSLREAALKAGSGDLTAQVRSTTDDEVGDLAKQFNQMLGEIRQRTTQNEQIMGTVGQGLFLVDAKGIISPEYSKETEKIFGQSLGNKSLLTILRPLLNDKSFLNFKDYLDILFDPKKREKLIVKANPLQEIEISKTDDRGNVKVNILEFKFNRIIEENKILQILVTVTDITRRVLLEREFKDVEKRSEAQLQMLLSVAHLDPQNLGRFLSNSLNQLQSVQSLLKKEESEPIHSPEERSHRYRLLLREIYRPVHLLKGNASVLNLKFFLDQSTQLENQIETIGTLSKIQGEDFLPITVAIGKLLDQINTTQNLIRRFGELGSLTSTRENLPASHSSKNALTTYLSARLAPFVEQTARTLGKEATLNTDYFTQDPFSESDADEISTILNQLVKNALIHGIETPDERIRNQKNRKGTLSLSSTIDAENNFVLRFKDDGRGIDPSQILEKAREKGLIDDARASQLTQEEIYLLLFHSGFSTLSVATEHAGRGVGLDAVKAWIDKRAGSISLDSIPQQGTEFTLIFPI